MRLDKEQKRVLKACLPASLTVFIGYPVLMLLLGKLDSWSDFFIYLGVGIIATLLLAGIYVLGSKIPKKD